MTTTAKPSEAAFGVPWGLRLRRWLLLRFFRGLFYLLCRVELKGFENIPEEGSYIVSYNHISLFEPPFVLSFWPRQLEGLAAADVFQRPGQGLLVRAYGAIPVHRDKYDRKVIDVVLGLLAAGEPMAIAPEGGRSHAVGLRRARPGVAYLMDRARVPVVPVGVVGSTEDMLARAIRGKRPRLEMRVGEPFTLPPIEGRGEARRAARQRNADLVMERMAALLPPEYRGVYGQGEAPAD